MKRLGIEPYMSQGESKQYRIPKKWYRRTSKGWIVARPRIVSEEKREGASKRAKIHGFKKRISA